MTPRDSHVDDEDESSTDGSSLSATNNHKEQLPTTSASLEHENRLASRAVPPMSSPRLPSRAYRPLGIIFDLDGTLVAEPHDDDHPRDDFLPDEVFLRPGVRRLLVWCSQRGHSLAVWTAAHAGWAHYVSWKLLQAKDSESSSSSSSSSTPSSSETLPRFEFVWDGSRLKKRRRIPRDAHGVETQGPTVAARTEDAATSASTTATTSCCWCGPYRHDCDRCECKNNRVFQCPCRFTKDLTKVWSKKRALGGSFSRARTLLIENTPQQCLSNYGNAVYVPTYRGDQEDRVLDRLQSLILQMECVEDVRAASKCSCPVVSEGVGRSFHACRVQSWCGEGNGSGQPIPPGLCCMPTQSTAAPQQVPVGWPLEHGRRRPQSVP
jgi:NLI interacting factor-like phosphatase